jgi:uncharacterized protein (TIGR00730 family)
VYGGAGTGLMGILAASVLAEGGEVIGVTPKGLFLEEVASHQEIVLHEVETMHERKALMAELSDGFIALPGGFGTCDELFEIITWAQLSLHRKPVGLLNVHDYFSPLLTAIIHAVNEGFISHYHANSLINKNNAADLLDYFEMAISERKEKSQI